MSLPNLKKKAAPGFTLVEMAIVLVIIGIILAGVMKGRDIVRGAQVKQFSQQFAQKWGTVAQTYYDKTGQQLNDGEINGGVATTNPDGTMDSGAAGRSEEIVDTLNNVGISACTIIKSKLTAPVAGADAGDPTQDHCGTGQLLNIFQTLVEGEYVGAQTVTVDLVGTALSIGGKTYLRNIVALYNVPADVARGLDTAVDGKEDGESGSCVCLEAVATPAVGAGALITAGTTTTTTVVAWPDANDRTVATVGIILDY